MLLYFCKLRYTPIRQFVDRVNEEFDKIALLDALE